MAGATLLDGADAFAKIRGFEQAALFFLFPIGLGLDRRREVGAKRLPRRLNGQRGVLGELISEADGPGPQVWQ
jgi:hypothetical protein